VKNALTAHLAIEDPTLRKLLGRVEPTREALFSDDANREFELHRDPQVRPVAHREQARMLLKSSCKAHRLVVPRKEPLPGV
jgi:hypothetical protein